MTTTINGVRLTDRQRTVLDIVLDHLRHHSGDSSMGPHTGPKGDGRWVPVIEIFPARNNHHNGLRRIVARLARQGVLRACEVDYLNGAVMGRPYHAASV